MARDTGGLEPSEVPRDSLCREKVLGQQIQADGYSALKETPVFQSLPDLYRMGERKPPREYELKI
jgi:hypothetical protein